MDIAEFLLARIAEDQEDAQAEWDWMVERHGPDFWTDGEGAPVEREWRYELDRDTTLHVSPRRVLAECQAKRRIVELHQPLDAWDEGQCSACSGRANLYPCATLRLLALPYAEHPDYDPAWSVLTSA